MAIPTRTARTSASVTPSNPQEITRFYTATATHVPLNGGASLFANGQSIAQKTEFILGVPVETYWNISEEPNKQIPNDVFEAAFVTDQFIIAGTPTATVKRQLLSDHFLLTDVPQTVAALLTAKGLSLPSETVLVEVFVDDLTATDGDIPKYGSFADVATEGSSLVSIILDTPEAIADTKFVVATGRTAKFFVNAYNAKN